MSLSPPLSPSLSSPSASHPSSSLSPASAYAPAHPDQSAGVPLHTRARSGSASRTWDEAQAEESRQREQDNQRAREMAQDGTGEAGAISAGELRAEVSPKRCGWFTELLGEPTRREGCVLLLRSDLSSWARLLGMLGEKRWQTGVVQNLQSRVLLRSSQCRRRLLHHEPKRGERAASSGSSELQLAFKLALVVGRRTRRAFLLLPEATQHGQ